MESYCATATAAEPTAIERSQAMPATRAGRPIRVLLVEDDPDAAKLAELFLMEDASDPFHVEWSSTLVQAINRLELPGIDVILLDLGMPELTGYRSYRAIEAATSHTVPVVVFSADRRTNIREAILTFGASDYLLKGFVAPEQLRYSLRQAVVRGLANHGNGGRDAQLTLNLC